MHRRRWGLGLLVIAVLAAVGAPRVGVIRVAGTASAPALLAPGRVGECLVEDPAELQRSDVRGADGYSGATTGPCGAPHFGEVVAMAADGRAFPRSAIDTLPQPDLGYCEARSEAYLGLVRRTPGGTPGQADVGFGVWFPVQSGSVVLIGPTAQQQRLGSRWVGCALYSPSGSYTGTVRDGLDDGLLNDLFAKCRNDIDAIATISCALGHRVELFGTATLSGSQIDQQSLSTSCAQMVRAVTGMPDPTAGNRLVSVALMFHLDVNGIRFTGPPSSVDPPAASAVCAVRVVSPDVELHHTLVGLGQSAVPLS